MQGILLAAPHSSSGKTALSAALLRAFGKAGEKVAAVKIGPDYIDPQFLRLANARDARDAGSCCNIDLWAMSPPQAENILARHVSKQDGDFILAEGVMGLFDGGKDGTGSSADVAALFGWTVVLVIDVRAHGETLAALMKGLLEFQSDITIGGVIFNRLRSASHEAFLRQVMQKHHPDLPILGFVKDSESLQFESRHLGLKQALEMSQEVNAQLDQAAELVARQVDLKRLKSLAQMSPAKKHGEKKPAVLFPPPDLRHIAIAKDEAFSFIYEHLLQAWRDDGTEISFFSPVRDEAPHDSCDMIFLPGGYPELQAEVLSRADNFRQAMRQADGHKWIYGECGGYMVMGESLTDFDGTEHAQLGLLPLRTSFHPSERHLGYRHATLQGDSPIGTSGQAFKTHEFHHAKISACDYGDGWQALWEARDSLGNDKGKIGHRRGKTAGSFLHIIASQATSQDI